MEQSGVGQKSRTIEPKPAGGGQWAESSQNRTREAGGRVKKKYQKQTAMTAVLSRGAIQEESLFLDLIRSTVQLMVRCLPEGSQSGTPD